MSDHLENETQCQGTYTQKEKRKKEKIKKEK